jgi:hypothetical protein
MARGERPKKRDSKIQKKQGKREKRRERVKNREIRYMRDKGQGHKRQGNEKGE